MSMFLLGVKSLVIESTSAVFTVALTVVKLSVLLSTRVFATDLHRASAISDATFFSIKESAKLFNIGSTSSSLSTLFPVMF